MLYSGISIEQQRLKSQPLADANPAPNRRRKRASIPWQSWAWAIILAVALVLASGGM